VDPPQQSVSPAYNDSTDLLESSLTFPVLTDPWVEGQEGPRIPAAPHGKFGKGAQNGLRKSPGTPATAFCQNCGKALCAGCVRTAPGGQVLCEPCFAAWQTYQQPFVPVSTGSPNPAAAAVLGLIPGVGAMYNGQFFKGLIHVVIFAVLVSMAHISGIFGIFIPGLDSLPVV
jgi:TM2 domain-containing membrane protein YozV